jgi:hypothetical protein
MNKLRFSPMSPNETVLLAVILFLLPMGVISGLLLRGGLRVSRRGSTPFCRACAYNLTGLTSVYCPECGLELTSGKVVLGEPHRSALRIGAGLVGLAVFAMGIFRCLQAVDWYVLQPTSWLITELENSDSSRAWREIDHRTRTESISVDNQTRLINLAIKQSASLYQPYSFPLLDRVSEWARDGKMPAQSRRTFFDQLFSVTMNIYPSKTSNDSQHCVVHYNYYPSILRATLSIGEFTIDGKNINAISITGNQSEPGKNFGSLEYKLLTQPPVGDQQLAIKCHVRVFAPGSMLNSEGRLLDEHDMTLSFPFELSALTPWHVKLSDEIQANHGK